MGETNRTIIGIFVALVVVVIVVFGWWYLSRDQTEEAVQTVAENTPTPVLEPTPSLEERLSSRLSGTTLATSDAVVRELAAEISSHPKLAAWLLNEDLIRRFVASVDNIASGISPRAHLEFLRPREGFEVEEQPDGALIIDEWRDQPACTYTAEQDITAGRHEVVVEYYEHTGAAMVAVSWDTIDDLLDDGNEGGDKDDVVDERGCFGRR